MDRPEIVEELDSKTGNVVARYSKGRLLGKGGFARCFEFTELESGRIYACKLIEKKTLTKPKTQQKLKSEIKIHSGLRHHNIVKFERFFEDKDNVYILLELCTQQTLMELHRAKRRLTEPEAVYLMRQTLTGVKYMHDRNIIHRDLKLGNLFLSEHMEVKVGDFGLAAQLEFDGERKLTVCGTPNYIAPEILEGGRHGHSFEVDIWSLGVILYTLLIGRPPFETHDIKMTYQKIRSTHYSFPDNVDVSPAARRLISRILQSNPESRPSLDDIMADPLFADHPLSCPYSLQPLGTARPPDRPATKLKLGSLAPVSKWRDPLKAISNAAGALGPSHALPSPKSGPQALGHLARPVSEEVAERLRAEAPPRRTRSDLCRRDSPLSGGEVKGLSPGPDQHNPIPQKKGVELDEEDQRNLTQLHQHLSICIQQPRGEPREPAPGPVTKPAVWVAEYSDFTAKYGLAYRLSYGHTGAAFNDGTKMIWDATSNRVEYMARPRDKHDVVRSAKAPEERTICTPEHYPEHLKKKITLIVYFRSYFAKYRGKPVTYPIVQANPCTNDYQPANPEVPAVFVKQWIKHTQAMVFRLSNKCFQVAFFDGTDILLSSEAKMVTYTDKKGLSQTFALETGRISHPDIAERLEYTQKILHQIMHKA